MDIAEKYGWKYIVTFKEGYMPDRCDEFLRFKKLCLQNEIELIDGKTVGKYSW